MNIIGVVKDSFWQCCSVIGLDCLYERMHSSSWRMLLILDGNSKHVARFRIKTGLFKQKFHIFDYCLSKMYFTDQITDLTLLH